MVRVWFNHWFSTSYRLIELMKEDLEEQIYVTGSNRQADSVIQKVCDEWYEEPEAEGEAYLQYCLEFCREHRIDVFVPRRMMAEVSRNIARFEAIGVKVLTDAYDMVSLLNDKAAAYGFFREEEQINIPEYAVVNNAAQFEEAYERLKGRQYGQLCMKFVHDEGAMSFRKIVENVDRFRRLRIYQGSDMAYHDLVDILKTGGEFDDLMIMPYLPGNEISVDCLNTESGLIAIPRIKGPARHERIEYDERILSMTKVIMNKTGLRFPCNIQYRVKDSVPYLLEINTRMSGGLQMSCLASGVNIPNIALNKLLGKAVPWKLDPTPQVVSYIEIPQIIRREEERGIDPDGSEGD